MSFTNLPYFNAQTVNYTLLNSDDVVQFNCSSGSLTATLPTAANIAGKRFTIRRAADATPANTLTVNTTSSQTIDTRASGSIKLQPSDYAVVMSDGSNWQVITIQETVAMRYFSSASSITGSLSAIAFATKSFDTHGQYSGSTYTVPSAGKYAVTVGMSIIGTFGTGGSGFGSLDIYKNGSQWSEFFNYSIGSADLFLSITDTVQCAAGDTLQIQASGNGSGMAIQALNRTFLTIVRVGD